MKILLVYRSSEKGGKSIEGLFERFLVEQESDFQLVRWEYDRTKSIFSNMLSLRRQQVDIWHITGDIYYMALSLVGKKVLLTIHDFGAYKGLNYWKRWIFKRVWILWPLRIANTVTVVSAYTRDEILKLAGSIFSDKIKVVYNAFNPLYSGLPGPFNSSRPRIMQVGTAPHKNLETLICAVSEMDCVLCIIGALTDTQRSSLRDKYITYESYQDLTEDEVREQYALADMVVFPSLHEGFGMPVIEAQAMGRPLITTRLTSLPEVAGSGAHYVDDPLDAEELRLAINMIIEEEGYRNNLINEGYKNVSRFTWPIMRESYYHVYKNILST